MEKKETLEESAVAILKAIGFFDLPQDHKITSIMKTQFESGLKIGTMNEFEKSCVTFMALKEEEKVQLDSRMDGKKNIPEIFNRMNQLVNEYSLVASFLQSSILRRVIIPDGYNTVAFQRNYDITVDKMVMFSLDHRQPSISDDLPN